MYVDDPDSDGKVRSFDFGPENGGWNNLNFNCLYGPGCATSMIQTKPNSSAYTACLDTEEGQDRAIINAINDFIKRQPNYGVFNHNCAHAIGEVLEAGGINLPLHMPTPSGLGDAIRDPRPTAQKMIEANGAHMRNMLRVNPYFCPLR